MKIKLYTKLIAYSISLACLLVFAITSCHGVDKPVVLTELDKEKVNRANLQLQLLQAQYQQQAKPIMDEQQSLVVKYCAMAHATPNVDCEINAQTGLVVKKSVTSPSAEKTVAPTLQKK